MDELKEKEPKPKKNPSHIDSWSYEERCRDDWEACDKLLELLKECHPDHAPKS